MDPTLRMSQTTYRVVRSSGSFIERHLHDTRVPVSSQNPVVQSMVKQLTKKLIGSSMIPHLRTYTPLLKDNHFAEPGTGIE